MLTKTLFACPKMGELFTKDEQKRISRSILKNIDCVHDSVHVDLGIIF